MEEYLRSLGVGLRPLDDPFFEEGNALVTPQLYKREGVLDMDEESLCHQVLETFPCEIPHCGMEFDNLLSWELHYNSKHRYACSECKKQLPTPHLLDLHISESHDSFFSALAERRPMYRCFVEECPVTSASPRERRSHCIEIHNYPHDFKYDDSNRKPPQLKKVPAKKKSPKKKEKKENGMECETKETEAKPHFPSTFSFGNKKPDRTFKRTKGKKEKPIEMHELMESLPS